ncbi:hypothetical protein R1flu_010902 [Riccia fluitans]|uniref:Secreted protein n=1 Tax=Riccia fluitans TaxID=41844 RepID=A0ABD1Z6G7_9MARC
MVATRAMVVETAMLATMAVVVVIAMVAIRDMIMAVTAVIRAMTMDREPRVSQGLLTIFERMFIEFTNKATSMIEISQASTSKLCAIMAIAVRRIWAEEHGTPQ